MKSLKLLFFMVVLAAGALSFLAFRFAHSPLDKSATTKKIEFDFTRGARPFEVSQKLEQLGIVSNGMYFYWLGKATGNWGNTKAADYELTPAMSPLQIFKIFHSGIGIQHALLVREGDNIYQVADTFESLGVGAKDEILRYLKSRELIANVGLKNEGIASLEGYLYPNTYFYDKREEPLNMIKRMVSAFERNWTPEYAARAQQLGMTRKQVVTLASMIEKETGAPQERPIISSVFHNRLKKHMRLQSDPTTIYGMWSRYTGNIHRRDLLTYSEYNTYTIPALPIGPIANPSAEAIRAALYPAETLYLYFVSRNDGTHAFSRTYEEHNEWVRKLQLDPSAREGKSWRDLKKNQSNQTH